MAVERHPKHEKKEKKDRTEKQKQAICLACGRFGHLAKDCHARDRVGMTPHSGGLVCFTCNGTGHKSSQCPSSGVVAAVWNGGRGGFGQARGSFRGGGAFRARGAFRGGSGFPGGGGFRGRGGFRGGFGRGGRGGRGGGPQNIDARVCHSCGGVGHSAAFCVKQPDGSSTCYTCGGCGHKSTICPTTARVTGGGFPGAGAGVDAGAKPSVAGETVLSIDETLIHWHNAFIVDSGSCTHICNDKTSICFIQTGA